MVLDQSFTGSGAIPNSDFRCLGLFTDLWVTGTRNLLWATHLPHSKRSETIRNRKICFFKHRNHTSLKNLTPKKNIESKKNLQKITFFKIVIFGKSGNFRILLIFPSKSKIQIFFLRLEKIFFGVLFFWDPHSN